MYEITGTILKNFQDIYKLVVANLVWCTLVYHKIAMSFGVTTFYLNQFYVELERIIFMFKHFFSLEKSS